MVGFSGKTECGPLEVSVPGIIEQPLARLKTAHQWEQRPANKAGAKRDIC